MKNELKNDPWIKLILVSLGGIIISLALIWTLQQFNSYNGSNMQGEMNGQGTQQDMNMQMGDNQMMSHMH